MYASPVVDTAKLENLDHADWLEETNMDELRYFSIGMIQKDIVVRWTEEIAPLAQ
jgi:putative spermidine/putrescine transport system substrate-binding protein